MKSVRSLVATLVFIVLLLSIYFVHASAFRVNVVFYSAIGDGLLAAGLAGLVLFGHKYFRGLSSFEKSQLIVIWVLAGYAFAISGPTVIDRSLSFYILEKLEQRGGGIRQASFEEVFTSEYMREHRLVDVRLTEQLESGTIVIENGCVKLTEKGHRIASFGRYFRQHWLPKKRLLMGEYSDDLTDPFRGRHEHKDYVCK